MEDDLTTSYFRFPDEATGLAALAAAGLLYEDEDGNKSPIVASHEHALDVIGVISLGGEWDKTGKMLHPPEVLPGWHFNYQGSPPADWEQYAVTPVAPLRKWL